MYYNKYIKYKKKYTNLKTNHNQLGGSVVNIDCPLDFTNLKYYIYHFSNSDTSNYNSDNKNIEYKHYNYETFKINELADIFNKCTEYNIIIYIENLDIPKITQNISDTAYTIFINNFNKKIKENHNTYYNVTIINKLFNENFSLIWSDKFKKIINVIIFNFIENILSENSIICTNDENDKSYICFIDDLTVKYKTELSRIVIINNQKYQYIIINNSNTDWIDKETNLNTTWWYLYYFKIPICSYGRLLQNSGTCWCNSILNSLLINTSVIKLLLTKNKQNTFIEERFLNALKNNSNISSIFTSDINNIKNYEDIPLNVLVLYIFKTILVDHNKATNLSGDVVLNIAWKLKVMSEKQKNNDNIKKYAKKSLDAQTNLEKYKSDLVNYNTRIREKLQLSVEEMDALTNLNAYIESSVSLQPNDIEYLIELNENIIKTNENIDTLTANIKIYKEDIDTLNYNNQILESYTNTYGESGNPANITLLLPILFDKNLILYKNLNNNKYEYNNSYYTINNNKLIIDNINDDYDIIIILYNEYKDQQTNEKYRIFIYENININNVIYECTSSSLALNGAPHEIAGLKCNDKFYVYDSNNYITYTDWTKWNHTTYNNNQYRELLIKNSSNSSYHYTGYNQHDKTIPPYFPSYVIYTKKSI